MQLELQLGAVNIFLTPRQLHALILLSDTFLSEGTKSHHHHHHHHQQHHMMTEHTTDNDNDNDDQASEYKTFNPMSGNLGMNQCWSSDPMGAYDNYYPYRLRSCCNFSCFFFC